MGHVYLAEHIRLGRKVALKRLKDRVAAEPKAVAQFMTEAQAVNRIHHPHIVDITDFCNDEAGVYYLMELLEGQTLAELLRKDGALTERRVLYIGHQMADALEAAHRADVLHLDIKPSNIFLVAKDGRQDYAKLLDFGIARLRDAAGEQTPKDAAKAEAQDIGPVTPAFMAPEQATTQPVDHRADIYSLGAVLYGALVGHPPFDARTLAEFVHKHLNVDPTPPRALKDLPHPVSAPCSRLVMRCLKKRPEDRPQSAGELRDLLAQVAESRCGIRLAPGLPPETAPRRVNWRRLGAVSAMVVLVLALTAAYFVWRPPGGGQGKTTSNAGNVGMGTATRLSKPGQRMVTLYLVSVPSGAEVFRQDVTPHLLGLTPLRVTALGSQDKFALRLKLAGYREQTLYVDLTQGSQTVHATLASLPRPAGRARPMSRPMRSDKPRPRPRPRPGGPRVRPRAGQPPPTMHSQPVMAPAMGTDPGTTLDPFAK